MTLTPGERYLCGIPPWGVCTVLYLGQVWMLKSWSKVRLLGGSIDNLILGKIIWVKTNTLKPFLVTLHGGGAQ